MQNAGMDQAQARIMYLSNWTGLIMSLPPKDKIPVFRYFLLFASRHSLADYPLNAW